MDTVLFLGGLFNITDPVIKFQLYIWLWVALVILAIIVHVIFYYGSWKPYTPLHGLYWAWKAGSNAALIFNRELKGEMVSERVAKCIFDYSKEEYEIAVPNFPGAFWIYSKLFYYPTHYLDHITFAEALVYKFGGVNKDVEIATQLQNGEWERTPSVTCAGVDVDIIVDADDWTIVKSKQHRAIQKCARAWNEQNPHDQVHSYSKFQRKLLEGAITCNDVQTTYVVDWSRIDKALTYDMETSEYVGKQMQMAEQEYNADQMTKNRMALWIFGASVLAWVIIGGTRLITHYF